MILLDTNVLSEAIKPHVAPAVRVWLSDRAAESLYISSITVAETMFGIGIMPKGKRRDALATSAQQAFALFGARILPFGAKAARQYGELAVRASAAGRGFPVPDGYIAAIAAAHGFAVATRDASAFEAAGLQVIDPWTA